MNFIMKYNDLHLNLISKTEKWSLNKMCVSVLIVQEMNNGNKMVGGEQRENTTNNFTGSVLNEFTKNTVYNGRMPILMVWNIYGKKNNKKQQLTKNVQKTQIGACCGTVFYHFYEKKTKQNKNNFYGSLFACTFKAVPKFDLPVPCLQLCQVR